jgi:hypothetical protein
MLPFGRRIAKSGPSALGRDPDFYQSREFSRRRLAYVHPLSRDTFATGQIETGPRLGHPAERHFLEGLTGFRVHDRRDNAHLNPIASGMNEWKVLDGAQRAMNVGSVGVNRLSATGPQAHADVEAPQF